MAHRNGNLKQVFMASIGGGFISLLLALLMGTTFTYTYDNATPVGTDAPSTLDDQDRNTKLAIQERENVDHYWELTGTQVSDSQTGEHRKVTFQGPIADPTTTANKGYFYTKDVSAVVEAHWKDESGNVLVLTDAGTLNIVSADLLGTVANNTFFTAVDQAGTGTVDLIKADTNDVAVLPDNSQTATNAAPTSSTGIANKKYVDDQVSGTAFGTLTGVDSDANPLIKDHAYLAQQDGIVHAFVDDSAGGDRRLSGYVGATNDPIGAGIKIVSVNLGSGSSGMSITFAIPSGSYWEVTMDTVAVTFISWQPMQTTGGLPVDQD